VTPLHPGDWLDHFRLDELVASGGMATVFRATDTRTGGNVAIKVPHPQAECDPVFFDRFRREAELGREMDHPGLVKVLPAVSGKRVYMAAEWVEGRTLRSLLQEKGRLEPERAVAIALRVCGILEYIHGRGVAHRDLKPENIVMLADGGLKLLDFGIATKPGARRLTFGKFSRIMGTADYISPEQLKGKRGDAQSDIYALGAILFEMVTGRAPFDGVNPFTLMSQRLAVEPKWTEIPEELRAVLRCALARDPSRRYKSAKEMAEDLRNPDEARNAWERGQRRDGKTPWIVSLALIPAAIFLAMLYVSLHR